MTVLLYVVLAMTVVATLSVFTKVFTLKTTTDRVGAFVALIYQLLLTYYLVVAGSTY